MINNIEIAEVIELSGKLFTLHGIEENKAKFYGGIAFGLERLEEDLARMDDSELLKVRGIGKNLLPTVKEIIDRGTSTELEDMISRTPEGILDMFRVKGLGVKKIKILWEELGIDNLNDLQIACESGKIKETKGFGEKTQKAILESLQFLKQQSGKLRMNQAKELSDEVQVILEKAFPRLLPVGGIPRSLETVSRISFLTDTPFGEKAKLAGLGFVEDMAVSSPFVWRGHYGGNQILIEVKFAEKAEFGREELLSNAARKHFSHSANGVTFFHFVRTNIFETPEEYYGNFGLPFIEAEMREGMGEFEWAKSHQNDELIRWEHLRGSLHNHSKYSDGKNTLGEMAKACQGLGLDYFGIADHSQTAAYANGLTAGRVVQQQAEIDELNNKMTPFKVLKGIESDILPDGDLDYEKDVLATFDYVVASVHANLDMDIERATNRLLTAIENPHTTILGHPTGRLLLSRKGYPIDFRKVIDACAANRVVMEINASPYRLDIDWRWIPYCMEKGVMLSINPDAHKIEGFQDMHYGMAVARKGGLTKDMTFNALPLEEMEKYLAGKR